MTRKHVMLVGLPGAGKTTAGRLVAERLGTTFVDFDALIEERAGQTVEQIFEGAGEPRFRTLEAAVGAELLGRAPGVLAPGGGYLMDADQRRLALDAAYLVYLETTPREAARRLQGATTRPLLKGFEPMLRLRLLLDARHGIYLEAQGRVTTDGKLPEAVANEVAVLARTHGGW